MPKTHEFVAPWVLQGLGAFKLSPAAARALPQPLGLPAGAEHKPPLEVPLGKRGETENVKGLSAAARLWWATVHGGPADIKAATAASLAWLAREAGAHQGPEINCPEPHRSFYYQIVVLMRQVAAKLDHAPLLAATGNWLAAERVMLEAFDGPGGCVGACFRADPKSAVDWSQCDWLLAFLRGQRARQARLPAENGLLALGDPAIAISPVARDLTIATSMPVIAPLRLGTPIRIRTWPGNVKTTELDQSQMPIAPVFPVLWTAVDLTKGARTLGRSGKPPRGAGVPRETILGGAWKSA